MNDLAEIWRKGPAVEQFIRYLPANTDNDNEITEALLTVDGGTQFVSQLPLFPGAWRGIASQLPLASMTESVDEYLARSYDIHRAAYFTVLWIRSKFSGDPLILAPQLAPNSARTSAEISRRVAWNLESMPRLRGQSTPYQVGPLLGLRGSAGVDRATRKLCDQLQLTDEWKKLESVAQGLDSSDRETLICARNRLAERSSQVSVNEYEPVFAVRREEFRSGVTDEVVEELAGPPADYASAFGALDDLVDLVVVEVFGQLVAYGAPRTVNDVQSLELMQADNGSQVKFQTAEPAPRLGQILWLNDALVDDAVQVVGVTDTWDEIDGIAAVEATVLKGTAAAWSR